MKISPRHIQGCVNGAGTLNYIREVLLSVLRKVKITHMIWKLFAWLLNFKVKLTLHLFQFTPNGSPLVSNYQDLLVHAVANNKDDLARKLIRLGCDHWEKCEVSPTVSLNISHFAWWRHQVKTFSALLALCARNSPVNGEFPSQTPVTRSFDIFFDLHLELTVE